MKNNYTPKQLKDVKYMIESYPNLDCDYIEQWIPELGLEEIYAKIKKTDMRHGLKSPIGTLKKHA
jgi:hypothetical protein